MHQYPSLEFISYIVEFLPLWMFVGYMDNMLLLSQGYSWVFQLTKCVNSYHNLCWSIGMLCKHILTYLKGAIDYGLCLQLAVSAKH